VGALCLDGVSVSYRASRRRRALPWRRSTRRWGLQDLTVQVGPGELVAVVGPNGSGKTTMLQTAAGVVRPDAGRVTASGRVLSLIDLSAGFHRELTGEENLRVQGALLGLGRLELQRRHEEVVAFSGLSAEALAQPFRTYSAGLGLRLGFALVAAAEPDVLLVDEVLAVGDEAFGRRCLDWVSGRRAAGMAVLLVTHDLALAETHADRVVVLEAGRAVFAGDPHEGLELHRRNAAAAVAHG
jgi:ABC-type polysaccharide/polyol phosphate transport system ATPase subunit